ncbi:MAG: EAL domain-containing protein [Desulfobacteraceae bacterium]|nr:EAL domain-containing protein [Desulfobacteraceae bacterium]
MLDINPTINLNLPALEPWTREKGNYLTGILDNARLHTALQPIFSLAHKRVVGYEALLRAQDKNLNRISPARLFQRNGSPQKTIRLDRLCRYIHLHNFRNLKDEMSWLFLNVSPETIINGKHYGSFFKHLLEKYDFPAHRIVIEVVEYPIGDNALLSEVIDFYKSLGCLIAIDDFGAGHSNFDRIWTLQPDIVKLDRSFLVKASARDSVRTMLSGIVTLLHQSGALVLIEGVETEDQAMMAIESEADFVQGFFFGRPFTDLTSRSPHNPENPDFERLFDTYKGFAGQEEQRLERKLERYNTLFANAVDRLKKQSSLMEATQKLLNDPKVLRCYQVRTDGVQMGPTLVSRFLKTRKDPRYKPLDDANSADWFRRHYLRRAILHPGQLQITRPYLSITGAHMCVTLSMRCASGPKDSILCCDIFV